MVTSSKRTCWGQAVFRTLSGSRYQSYGQEEADVDVVEEIGWRHCQHRAGFEECARRSATRPIMRLTVSARGRGESGAKKGGRVN